MRREAFDASNIKLWKFFRWPEPPWRRASTVIKLSSPLDTQNNFPARTTEQQSGDETSLSAKRTTLTWDQCGENRYSENGNKHDMTDDEN